MIRCKVAGFPLTISLEKLEQKVFLNAYAIPVQFEARQEWKAILKNKTGGEIIYNFFFLPGSKPTRNHVLSWMFSEKKEAEGLPEFFGESYPAVKELFAD